MESPVVRIVLKRSWSKAGQSSPGVEGERRQAHAKGEECRFAVGGKRSAGQQKQRDGQAPGTIRPAAVQVRRVFAEAGKGGLVEENEA
jgi:hypothetical protein